MSSESSQKWLERNRPPRVQISYEVETGGASKKRELPMVVGILADLGGKAGGFVERRFIDIDRDNFDKVMKKTAPTLTIKGIEGLSGDVTFEKLEDFEPDQLVLKVEGLKDLFKQRAALRDLMAKIDGNVLLGTTLSEAVKDNETIARWGVKVDDTPAPEKKALATLDAAAIKALPAETFAAYTDAELGALTVAQLEGVTEEQAKALQERKPFSADQIAALPTELQALFKAD